MSEFKGKSRSVFTFVGRKRGESLTRSCCLPCNRFFAQVDARKSFRSFVPLWVSWFWWIAFYAEIVGFLYSVCIRNVRTLNVYLKSFATRNIRIISLIMSSVPQNTKIYLRNFYLLKDFFTISPFLCPFHQFCGS